MIDRFTTPAARPLAANSPYRNIRAGVKYVGDAACARCHRGHRRSLRRPPNGTLTDGCRCATIPGTVAPSFQAQGLEYSVERRGDRVFHKETKRDASGKVVSQVEAEARHAIGSGEQAIAFLLERGDGHLFESPITWYSAKQKWDLSPGYERDNLHFERFIKPACLFCHSNQFDHVEETENRYRQPIFQGHAIGCERCHGPGELHIRKPEHVGDELPNIVNPASSNPFCVKQSANNVTCKAISGSSRAGRRLTDYRPGLPLSSIESVL